MPPSATPAEAVLRPGPAAVTLEVTALGAGGDGIVELSDGRAFVPLALPGEIVRARRAGSRAGHGVYEPEAWLREAPDRAQPRCRHFGACGGCAVQHLADAAYDDWKRGLLVGALARAGFAAAAVAPLVRTPPGRRRAPTSPWRGRRVASRSASMPGAAARCRTWRHARCCTRTCPRWSRPCVRCWPNACA